MTRINSLKNELLHTQEVQQEIVNAFGAEFADPGLASRCEQLEADIASLEAEATRIEKANDHVNTILSAAGLQYLNEYHHWVSGKTPTDSEDILYVAAETTGQGTIAHLSITWDPNNEVWDPIGRTVMHFDICPQDGQLTFVVFYDKLKEVSDKIHDLNIEFRRAEIRWIVKRITDTLLAGGYHRRETSNSKITVS